MALSSLTDQIPLKDKMDHDQILKVSLMKPVIKPTSPHRHANYHEMILLDEGSGFHEIDGQQFEIISPVMYYLRPGQTHCWNFSAIPKGYVILFREELLLKDDVDLLYNFPSFIALKEQPFLFSLVAEFYSEFKIKSAGTSIYKAYLHLLIAKLKEFSSMPKTSGSGTDQLFQSYRRKVNGHFLQQKQPAFYAGILNVTVAVLNESCKKSAGKTALAIINERVLLEAKLLLSATNKPISNIAIELKFSDSPHFIKFFKNNTNFTPGQYREMAIERK